MVVCESTDRDGAREQARPGRRDHADESPVADTVPADLFPQARLLDSLAAFTHHRDVNALDHSLVLSLAELTSAQSVILAKRAIDGPYVESLVHCIPDPNGGYQVQALEVDEASPSLSLLYRCLHRMEAQTAMVNGLCRLVVPITRDGKMIGVMQLDSHVVAQVNRPLVDGFARIYANYTALLHESERDKLTGLYNRRSLDRQLQKMLHECATALPRLPELATEPAGHRHGAQGPGSIWLAILDIDNFKKINDNYGHIYGDEVILLLAQQMRACFRRTDVLFRFGGEEFVILFNASEEAVVRAILERFRQRVAGHTFPQVGTVTVSIGYASVGKHDYPASALDRADKALYFAKQHGRNCIHGYEDLAGRGLLGSAVAAGSIDLF